MRTTPRLASSAAEVLLRLTSPKRDDDSWNAKDGVCLYESRALTEMVCQRLVRHGYLDEAHTDDGTVYTVNQLGRHKADELRLAREGVFLTPLS